MVVRPRGSNRQQASDVPDRQQQDCQEHLKRV
jgi:hypothetical protein